MADRFLWGTRRDNYLIKHYHDMSASALAACFGISKSAVLRRARILGIPKKTETYHHQPYTHAEIALILEKVNKVGVRAVADEINRSEQAIRVFCKRRNIRIKFSPNWSRAQTKYLKESGPSLTVEELAIKLKKSPLAIRKYANEHNITLAKSIRVGKPGPWSEADHAYLVANIHRPYHEIALHLGRTAEAVTKYASTKKLTKSSAKING